MARRPSMACARFSRRIPTTKPTLAGMRAWVPGKRAAAIMPTRSGVADPGTSAVWLSSQRFQPGCRGRSVIRSSPACVVSHARENPSANGPCTDQRFTARFGLPPGRLIVPAALGRADKCGLRERPAIAVKDIRIGKRVSFSSGQKCTVWDQLRSRSGSGDIGMSRFHQGENAT